VEAVVATQKAVKIQRKAHPQSVKNTVAAGDVSQKDAIKLPKVTPSFVSVTAAVSVASHKTVSRARKAHLSIASVTVEGSAVRLRAAISQRMEPRASALHMEAEKHVLWRDVAKRREVRAAPASRMEVVRGVPKKGAMPLPRARWVNASLTVVESDAHKRVATRRRGDPKISVSHMGVGSDVASPNAISLW